MVNKFTKESLTLRQNSTESIANKSVCNTSELKQKSVRDVSQTDRLDTVGADKSSETMTNTKTQHTSTVKIYDAGGELTKRWFVYYNFNFQGSSFSKRFKEYGNVNSLISVAERYRAIIDLQSAVIDKLAKGFNPFEYEKEKAIDTLNSKSLAYLLMLENNTHKRYLRKKSGTTYESHLNGFVAWLQKTNNKNATNISKEQALDFLNHLQDAKGSSNTTRNAYLKTLRMYFNRLKITPNAFENIKKLSEYRQGKLPFTDEYKAKVIEHVKAHDEQLWLAIQFLYYCMIRPNEMRFLKIEHIDFENWLIRVPGEVSKNKKTQVVEVPIPLREELKRINLMNHSKNHFIFSHSGKPGATKYSRDNFGKRHKEILRKLNIPSTYSFYSWKHTGNIALVKSGVGLKSVQLQNRHHDLNTLDIYLKTMGAYRNDEVINRFPRL